LKNWNQTSVDGCGWLQNFAKNTYPGH